MEKMKDVFLSEIEALRQKGHMYYNGEMSMMDFKHSSGGMGVYGERGGKKFMVRLRVPSGTITMPQLKLMYDLAKKYNLGGLHFTTRQAVQYHGLSIDDVCDLMKEALDNDIYTRGAGGNFPRNVALSPLSGVDENEPFDPTPYALATGNYFMDRITTYKLPRKLKVSFSNTEEDTAHCTIQDLGFLAVNENGNKKFRVYLGGGLGRNPRIALIYPELIDPKEVLYYVQGMVDLFINEGNYENRAKARVRYMVEKLGEEAFIKEYTKYVDEAKKKGGLDIYCEDTTYNKEGIEADLDDNRVYNQKQKGLYSVYLHPVGGQIKLEELKNIIDILNKCDNPEIRLSMTEGVYFRNLNGNEAKDVLDVTKEIGGKTSFEYSVSCIGAPTCQIGLGYSQEALKAMIDFVKSKVKRLELLPRVYISGCGNSCGIHEIGAIGFAGKRKRVGEAVTDVFEVHVDGSFEENKARLGEYYGDVLQDKIPEFIYDLAQELEAKDKCFCEYIKSNKDSFKALFEKYAV